MKNSTSVLLRALPWQLSSTQPQSCQELGLEGEHKLLAARPVLLKLWISYPVLQHSLETE